MKTAVVSGHTIIASVHQPRSAIWNLFDSVGDEQGLTG
jgi:hypothetical protein